jgi:hypothetical protein
VFTNGPAGGWIGKFSTTTRKMTTPVARQPMMICIVRVAAAMDCRCASESISPPEPNRPEASTAIRSGCPPARGGVVDKPPHQAFPTFCSSFDRRQQRGEIHVLVTSEREITSQAFGNLPVERGWRGQAG